MADGNNDLTTWTSFVEADYLAAARTYGGNCPTCTTPRDCNNYFCLICKQGGLCPATFRGDGQHTRHPWLQVRRLSRQSAVDPKELAKYIDPASVRLIQSILQNNGSLCYLRTKSSDLHRRGQSSAERIPIQTSKSILKRCGACEVPIPNSQGCKRDILLCCLQCLITLAEQQPERNLLALQEGALAPTEVYPRTIREKVNDSRHVGSATTSGSASTSVSESASTPVGNSNLNHAQLPPTPVGNSNLNHAQLPPDTRSRQIFRLAQAAVANGDWDLYVGKDRPPRLIHRT